MLESCILPAIDMLVYTLTSSCANTASVTLTDSTMVGTTASDTT